MSRSQTDPLITFPPFPLQDTHFPLNGFESDVSDVSAGSVAEAVHWRCFTPGRGNVNVLVRLSDVHMNFHSIKHTGTQEVSQRWWYCLNNDVILNDGHHSTVLTWTTNRFCKSQKPQQHTEHGVRCMLCKVKSSNFSASFSYQIYFLIKSYNQITVAYKCHGTVAVMNYELEIL